MFRHVASRVLTRTCSQGVPGISSPFNMQTPGSSACREHVDKLDIVYCEMFSVVYNECQQWLDCLWISDRAMAPARDLQNTKRLTSRIEWWQRKLGRRTHEAPGTYQSCAAPRPVYCRNVAWKRAALNPPMPCSRSGR